MLPSVSMECRAVAEPALRFSTTGLAICKVRVVSSSRKKDEGGSWVDDKTCFLDVVTFGKSGENLAESVAKGDLITVTGRLSQNDWEDKEGNKRTSYEVVADYVGVALTFRTVPHGAGKAERGSTSAPANDDPWGGKPAAPEEPPFHHAPEAWERGGLAC